MGKGLPALFPLGGATTMAASRLRSSAGTALATLPRLIRFETGRSGFLLDAVAGDSGEAGHQHPLSSTSRSNRYFRFLNGEAEKKGLGGSGNANRARN